MRASFQAFWKEEEDRGTDMSNGVVILGESTMCTGTVPFWKEARKVGIPWGRRSGADGGFIYAFAGESVTCIDLLTAMAGMFE